MQLCCHVVMLLCCYAVMQLCCWTLCSYAVLSIVCSVVTFTISAALASLLALHWCSCTGKDHRRLIYAPRFTNSLCVSTKGSSYSYLLFLPPCVCSEKPARSQYTKKTETTTDHRGSIYQHRKSRCPNYFPYFTVDCYS